MAEKTVIESTMLYDGKVKVDFYPNSHRYKVDGETVPGVTTILNIKDKSGPLVYWAVDLFKKYLIANIEELRIAPINHISEGAKQHTIKKEEAANTGTKIHDWCEQYIKGQNPGMPEEDNVIRGVTAFLDWENEHNVKFLSSERMVYSKKHKFVGTMDIEAIIDGKRCLVDLKTGNGLYNSVRLQTAAYAKADEEENGKPYEGRWAIRLSKESEAEYHARMAEKGKTEYPPYVVFEAKFLDHNGDRDMDRDFSTFLCAKDLYDWDKETSKEFYP